MLWYMDGLAGLAWYIVWPGGHRMVLWLCPGGPGMGYGMALRASHGVVWPRRHRIVYGMAWWASHGIWLWPGRQDMGLGIVYGMAWWAWHGIWYGLAGKEWCMVWPGGHSWIYGMAWRPWNGICYGLGGITWYMVWPGGHRMVHGMAWRGISWYVEKHSITCFKALSWAIVPFTRGVADVSWKS